MAIDILMPALSPTMTEGSLAKWLVKPGDQVNPGDVIAEIETDKATMEFEAADEGEVEELLVEEGTEGIAINTPIMRLKGEGPAADVAPPSETKPSETKPSETKPSETKPAEEDKEQDKDEKASSKPSKPAAKPVRQQSDDAGAMPQPPAETAYDGEVERKTVREALRDAMAEEMRRDEAVFLMGEEVGEYEGAYKVSQGLLAEFGPKRVIDTPITEHGFAGLGVGAAFGGLKPVVEFMTFNFAMQAIDHIINSAAKTLYMAGGKMGCPIVFRGPNGAAARVAAQHSQEYASWYAHVPGLKVIAPYDAADAKGLLKAAIRDPNPVVFLEHELMYGQSFDDVPTDPEHVLPIGRARVIRPGDACTVVAYSRMVGVALEAAAQLAESGIEVEVIDLRTIRPLDVATVVDSVKRTNRLVSVEEGWPFAGIGSEMAALMMEHAFDHLDAPVVRVHAADVPLPYAANLEKLALPQAGDVVKAVKKAAYLN